MSASLLARLQLVTALTHRQMVAAAALGLGALLVGSGLFWLLFDQRRKRQPERGDGDTRPLWNRDAWLSSVLLLLIVAVGAWLRLQGLDSRSLSHTEAILPNLVWPPDTWPPTRLTFYDTFWWQYHAEPHPPAHYLLVWAWTKVFGTSLTQLRLPSALLGIGSILLTYWLARITFERRVGLVAAALVSFNALHLYFSQYGRVFMMGTFLALLSTLALVQVLRGGTHRLRWEICYVLASLLAVYTQTFYWLVLATQVVWLALQLRTSPSLIKRLLTLQALVVMLGAPAIAHLIYRGDPVILPPPNLTFAAEYLGFGFALLGDYLSDPPRLFAPPVLGSAAVCGLVLAVLGARAPRRASVATRAEPVPALLRHPVLIVAFGASLVTLGLAIVAMRRRTAVSFASVVPAVALGMAPLYDSIRTRLERWRTAAAPHRIAEWLSDAKSINTLLAFLPPLGLFLLSFRSSLLISRGFLIFVPYLLILAAAGTVRLARKRLLIVPLVVALVVLHATSVRHIRAYPGAAWDYPGLAERLRDRLQPGDMIFVRPHMWVITPLYYYLQTEDPNYVTRDYARAAARVPAARVWLLYFGSRVWGSFDTATEEMRAALNGYQEAEQLTVRRIRAVLLVRNE